MKNPRVDRSSQKTFGPQWLPSRLPDFRIGSSLFPPSDFFISSKQFPTILQRLILYSSTTIFWEHFFCWQQTVASWHLPFIRPQYEFYGLCWPWRQSIVAADCLVVLDFWKEIGGNCLPGWQMFPGWQMLPGWPMFAPIGKLRKKVSEIRLNPRYPW